MQIYYDSCVSEVFRPMISEKLDTVIDLFPDWCTSLIIFYNEDTSKGNILACNSNYPYRFMHLTFYPGFFNDPEWEEGLIHEIQHAIQAPYVSRVEHIINTYIDNEELKDYVLKDLADLEEGVCQDWVALLIKWREKYGK
jgi:hypothetical protein